VAGSPTPAGLALIANNLFTLSQLQALGGVKPYIAPPPPGEVGNSIFREVSTVLSWPIKITERFNVEPSVSAYNAFNLANFNRLEGFLDNPPTPYAPGTTGPAGNVNGTTRGFLENSVRTGTGSGVFSLGAPRQLEFGLKLNF